MVDYGDDGGSATFLLIKEAWDTLSDPAKRAAYDKGLAGKSLWIDWDQRGFGREGWTDRPTYSHTQQSGRARTAASSRRSWR